MCRPYKYEPQRINYGSLTVKFSFDRYNKSFLSFQDRYFNAGTYTAKTILIKQTIKARIVHPNKQPSSALKYSFSTNISFQSSKVLIQNSKLIFARNRWSMNSNSIYRRLWTVALSFLPRIKWRDSHVVYGAIQSAHLQPLNKL